MLIKKQKLNSLILHQMPDNAATTDTAPDQVVPVQPIPEQAPVSNIDQKIRDYSEQRVQKEQEFQQKARDKSQTYDNSASKAAASSFGTSLDKTPASPFQQIQSTAYNAKDFERYYTHPLFTKLGFDPFEDNEERYNKQATGWQDLVRASRQWGGLAMTGFKSATPWQNP